MLKSLKETFGQCLRVKSDYDLRTHSNLKVVGALSPEGMSDLPDNTLYRPRLPSQRTTQINDIGSQPESLRRLYNIVVQDMLSEGYNPLDFNMYILWQRGVVKPSDNLRAGFWHFDLERLLKDNKHTNHLPIAINYAASNILPTIYLSRLISDAALPARQTLEVKEKHKNLSTESLLAGYIYRPNPGEVVRYDNLTMHRGAPNDTLRTVSRSFMHLAFVSK